MLKKFSVGILLGILVLSLVGCSNPSHTSNQTQDIDSEAKTSIETALEHNKSMEDSYLIDVAMKQGNADSTYYIEVCDKDGMYMEYPVDKDGNLGTLDYLTTGDSTNYLLETWLTDDNYYLFQTTGEEEDDYVAYTFPKSFAEKTRELSRDTLYMDYMLDKFTSLSLYATRECNIGNGQKKYTMYKGILPSQYANLLFGLDNNYLYESIKKDYPDDDKLQKLCDFYLEELGNSLVCSDATVMIGVSDDNYIEYVDITIGGIGTTLNIINTLILEEDLVNRDKPDVSTTKEFVETLNDIAETISKYDNYDDAVLGLSNEQENSTTEEVTTEYVEPSETTSEEIQTDDNIEPSVTDGEVEETTKNTDTSEENTESE